jgi:hypothetical protein
MCNELPTAPVLQPIVATVEGSFASAGSGGGIFGTQCGVKLVNSQLQGNVAAANGGGAALQLCTAVLEQSTVENNEVSMSSKLPAYGVVLLCFAPVVKCVKGLMSSGIPGMYLNFPADDECGKPSQHTPDSPAPQPPQQPPCLLRITSLLGTLAQ